MAVTFQSYLITFWKNNGYVFVNTGVVEVGDRPDYIRQCVGTSLDILSVLLQHCIIPFTKICQPERLVGLPEEEDVHHVDVLGDMILHQAQQCTHVLAREDKISNLVNGEEKIFERLLFFLGITCTLMLHVIVLCNLNVWNVAAARSVDQITLGSN